MYRMCYRNTELFHPFKKIKKSVSGLTLLMLIVIFWVLPPAIRAQQYYPSEPTVPSQGSAPEARMKAPDNLLPFPSGVPQVNPPAQPNPLAPTLLTTIEGISFIEDATLTGFFHIPPDPHGAVGPKHVVSVVNVSIEWHTKTGTQQNSQTLASFFSSLSPLSLFDPKVLYDQFSNRFVVVVLDQTSVPNDPANTSRILLAVSDDNDPNGTWYFHEIPSVFTLSGSDSAWTDYPGFAVDEEAVYVTGNLFSFITGLFSGSRLWIINKIPFYSGGAASVNVYDPVGAVGQMATTMQPAHIYGTAPAGVGTWLVRYSGFSDGTNESLSIIRVDNPLGTPSFSHQFVSLGDIDNTAAGMPDAPQSGTGTLIDTGDRRALDAVWRNNSLYTCASVVPGSGTDAGQATAHWWQVNTTTLSSLSLTDQGNIGGEDIATGAYTFYPSVAVDQNDNLAIGFAASASSIFPGAYYTGRLSTDPAGTVQSSGTLAAGLDYYVRTFGAGRNRWGDYSAMSIDPTDELTFWVFNEYALTRGNPTSGGEDGQWGNRWGRFKLNQQSVNPGDIIITEIMQNPAAVADANGEWVELYNNTASAIDIDGWTLRDSGTDSHVINNSGPLLVPANGFVVLGIDSNSTTNGNYTADYQYSNFVLDNTSDEVILADLTGTVIDSVAYDGGVTFPNPNGASMALTVFIADNSVGSNWTTSTVREPSFVGSSGDLGSPGTVGSDQTLPVELAAFTVTAGDKDVVLNWVTESETENVGFKILRATREDGEYTLLSSYETNPDLEGQLTSNTRTEYTFEDQLVVNGATYWYKLVDVDIFGIHTEHGPLVATPQSAGSDVTTLSANAPKKFKLYPNFPNPFNPETTLQVDIPALDKLVPVQVTVYNALGQKVRTIFNGALAPGTHALKWRGIDDNGNHVPSGVYFAQIKAAQLHQVVKMILLK